ncbi:PRA1 family protein H [Rhodamnia argentea]|uniref:PRA1 family protein n=1 Tax=Rhodamnia argentea TaxID=178133 RepID=A0A8B8MM25_9MYRT|nr:PRA1 family protein H [Rhodamnia argentea]
MAFKANPFSLTVPEHAFESWLRDSGYLEVLDQRSSSLAAATAADTSSSGNDAASDPYGPGFFASVFSGLGTLLSLVTLNPLSKLTTDDLSGETPSWTHGFIGSCDSYSFPSSPTQARLRVHENVKRFARNYATLFILFLACALYQMPFALIGLLSSLALWDFLKFSSDKWGLDQRPAIRQCLVRTAQIVTALILIWCNVQMALFCALCVSYAALMLHAAFRKLTPSKPPHKKRK